MEAYEKSAVGKLIAWSGDHFVYEYGEDKVIKFSKFEFILGHSGREKAKRDHEMCIKAFGSYILPTEFLRSPKGKHVAKVQARIEGRGLTKADMANPVTKAAFLTFVEAYTAMLEAGTAVPDLIGGRGALRSCLNNIFVRDDGSLAVIDTTLIEAPIPSLRPLVAPLQKFALARQDKLIKMFLSDKA